MDPRAGLDVAESIKTIAPAGNGTLAIELSRFAQNEVQNEIRQRRKRATRLRAKYGGPSHSVFSQQQVTQREATQSRKFLHSAQRLG